jgi:LAGLIDADG endonuclease
MHVTQKASSVSILYAIQAYFGCGVVKTDNQKMDGMKYQLSSYKDIDRVLIPFLEEYPLLTSKYLNYLDFKRAIEMLKNGEHLTREGIEKLKEMAQNMNTNRSFKDKWQFTQEHLGPGLSQGQGCPKAVLTPQWIQGFTLALGLTCGKPGLS